MNQKNWKQCDICCGSYPETKHDFTMRLNSFDTRAVLMEVPSSLLSIGIAITPCIIPYLSSISITTSLIPASPNITFVIPKCPLSLRLEYL